MMFSNLSSPRRRGPRPGRFNSASMLVLLVASQGLDPRRRGDDMYGEAFASRSYES
jgi:hypothetical protein